MSLPRNTQDRSENLSPQEELSRLWQNVMSLRAEERRSAEDKYQITLLLATVDKLCEVMTEYMDSTQTELRKMNENQLRLLNVQEEYRGSVKKDAAKVLNDNYSKIVDHQNAAFDTMLEHTKTVVSEMETTVDKCTDRLGKVGKITGFASLWYSLAPIAVIAQVIIMIWQHFS